jgi:hypothetical protein
MHRLTWRSQTIVLVLLLAFVVQFEACGGSQIDRAAKASLTIGTYTGEAITIVGTLFQTKAINLQTKDRLADLLENFSRSGRAFNDLVKAAQAQFKGGTLPGDKWAQITSQFNQLIQVFLQIVDVIPQAAGLANSKAFKTITAAVLAIAQILMSTAGVPRPTQMTARNAFKEINARIARCGISLAGVEI